jgi:hypothetical protein
MRKFLVQEVFSKAQKQKRPGVSAPGPVINPSWRPSRTLHSHPAQTGHLTMRQKLRDLADVRAGYPFRGRVVHEHEGDLAVVQMKDIGEVAGLTPHGCLRINSRSVNPDRHLLQRGDVLIQSRGQKFPAAVVDQPIFGIAALGLYVIRPTATATPEYLAWFLNLPRTRAALRGIARGTHIPFLSASDLREVEVPLPPLETQRRIAQIEQLRRRERQLADRLRDLNDQLIDEATWRAASATTRAT